MTSFEVALISLIVISSLALCFLIGCAIAFYIIIKTNKKPPR
jgi:uncharacterized protein YneF (UPF0154 family)